MPIVFNCSGCDRQLRAKDDAAGRQARCPQCGTITDIPAPAQQRHPWDDEDDGTPEYRLGGTAEAPAASAPTATATRPCPHCNKTIAVAALECEHCGEALEPPGAPRPRQRRRKRREPAGFWLRFVAYFLDYMILSVGTCILALPFGVFAALQGLQPIQIEGPRAVFELVGFVSAWLYFALQESSSAQATLGKRALGIIVTDLDGRPISFGRATGRYFGKLVSGVLCFAGYIMAAFTEQKQALHDLMASTLVVRK